MYGIIDMGSNTIRLSCYRVANQDFYPVFHNKHMAGLASYVEDGKLSKKGIAKAIDILNDFKNITHSVGFDDVFVIATASIRNVSNTNAIIEEIMERTGFRVQVLSGEKEAELDFIGATHCISEEEGIVVDIGGGSTELVFFKDKKIERAVSIPVGSLNLFSEHVERILPKKKEILEIREKIRQQLYQSDLPQVKRDIVLGVGGTNRATGKLYNEFYDMKLENTIVPCADITKLIDQFMDDKSEVGKQILKIVPARMHTIIPGMLIMDEIQKLYHCKTMKISSWGVREGYLIEKMYHRLGLECDPPTNIYH